MARQWILLLIGLVGCSGEGAATGSDGSADAALADGSRDGARMLDAALPDGAVAPDGRTVDGGAPPDFSLSGPVIVTTPEMLSTAWERFGAGRQPFLRAWQNVLRRADESLDDVHVTYTGTDHVEYFRAARVQSQVARANAVAHRLTGDARYSAKAREILLLWARDTGAYPFSLPEVNHSVGLVLGRTAVIFADTYALVHRDLGAAERRTIESWLAAQVPAIQESQRIWVEDSLPGFPAPYLGRQYFNNHLGAQTMGMLAIGYATGDDDLVAHAISGSRNPRDLQTLLGGAILMGRSDVYVGDPTLTEGRPDPMPGEIFDRYRTVAGDGLHYSHLHLRLLTLMALMAHNNGWPRDYFAYVGPDGEQLVRSHAFYARFLVSGRPDDQTGYYAGEADVDWRLLPLLEVANRFFPGRPEIVRALSARDRVRHDAETFGWTAVLLHGTDDVPDGRGRWTFDREGDDEGWAVRRALSARVRDGVLFLEVTGSDPAILSPRSLGFDAADYRALTLRMRNDSAESLCQVFFATDAAPSFHAERAVSVPIRPHDDEFRDYTVDLSSHDQWVGTVAQLRIDVVSGAEGRVSIDSITLR